MSVLPISSGNVAIQMTIPHNEIQLWSIYVCQMLLFLTCKYFRVIIQYFLFIFRVFRV